jgi:peptidoglycan/xylan/chitin deacetylase (PgdA/CDA1 family)
MDSNLMHTKDQVSRFTGRVVYESGLYRLFRQLEGLRDGFIILHYHKVEPGKRDNGRLPSCSELIGCSTAYEDFIQHMQLLKEYFHPFSLKEAVSCLIKGQSIPKNAVVVTLDDGFKEVFLNAFPILKRYGIPAAVFCPGQIFASDGVDRIIWEHKLFHALDNTQRKEFEIEGKRYSLLDVEEKYKTTVSILNMLKERPRTLKESFLELLVEELGVNITKATSDQLYLSREDIFAMKEHGMTIGVHSMTHPKLSKLSGRELEAEIKEARKIIEEVLGETSPYFAWPYGGEDSYNKEAIKMLKESGYLCARSTEYGINNRHTDLYGLRSIYAEVPFLNFVLRTSVPSILSPLRRILNGTGSNRFLWKQGPPVYAQLLPAVVDAEGHLMTAERKVTNFLCP